jgi:hypothetical protein
MDTGGDFSRGKAVAAWSWPPTFNKCQGQGYVDRYFRSPLRLHGIMLN